MLKNLKPGSAEFKAGTFIIISLVLLVFSLLWLRYFAIAPEKKIIAQFQDSGPVEKGIPVYYQGVNIGKVPKVGFSKNFKYAHVYIDVYNKELELPANVTATVKIEGIAGQKYLSINYPERPVKRLLVSGDIIEGERVFGLADIQEFFKREIKSGRLQKMFDNVDATLANANTTTAKIGETSDRLNHLLAKYDKDIENIIKSTSDTVIELNNVISSPEIQETIDNINKITQNTEEGTSSIFGDVEKTKLIPNVNATVHKTYVTLEEADCAIKAANQAACRFDCVGKKLSNMLGQRFLLFKLMFGRPGEIMEECEEIGKCP